VKCEQKKLLHFAFCCKQDSSVTEILSAASAAHCGALWRTLMSLLLVAACNLPPYCTYVQKLQLPEISLDDEKSLVITVTQLAQFDTAEPQLC